MTWLHRLTVFAYAFMAASSAYSASLPTGHGWHIGAAVCWTGLTALAWRNGRTDARLREATRLSAMADGMASVAGGVESMAKELGPVAYDIAAAAYGAAAEKRSEALAVLSAMCLLLIGCAESPALPADAGHRAPDLGGCVGLAATLTDAGPVAHVIIYPDGHPCGDGGVCRMGACEP